MISTDTFKLSYDLSHTRTFLDQAHANTLGGFLPNTTSPDPDFGRCLQCAAVDRARFKSSSNISRSDICTKCFKQYCFDPADPPSKDALPNRKLEAMDTKLDIDDFKDVPGFFERHKAAFIGGIVAAIAFVAAVIALMYVSHISLLEQRLTMRQCLEVETEGSRCLSPRKGKSERELRASTTWTVRYTFSFNLSYPILYNGNPTTTIPASLRRETLLQ